MSKFITGFAFGLALWGLVTLIGGVALLFPMRIVRGARARLIGVVAILPLLLAFGFGYIWASMVARNGWEFTLEELRLQGMVVEAALILSAIGTMYLIAARSVPAPAGGTGADLVNEAGRDAGDKSGREPNDEQDATTNRPHEER